MPKRFSLAEHFSDVRRVMAARLQEIERQSLVGAVDPAQRASGAGAGIQPSDWPALAFANSIRPLGPRCIIPASRCLSSFTRPPEPRQANPAQSVPVSAGNVCYDRARGCTGRRSDRDLAFHRNSRTRRRQLIATYARPLGWAVNILASGSQTVNRSWRTSSVVPGSQV
jgi:hypothetical protein